MDILHYLNLKKPFYKQKLKKTPSKPDFQNFLSLTLHQNDLYHSNVLFVKKFLIDLYTYKVFCKIYMHLFEIQTFHPIFHPLKTRFTKPRFSENPHLVNKSLLTRHVTKWGFDCNKKPQRQSKNCERVETKLLKVLEFQHFHKAYFPKVGIITLGM